MTEPVPTDDPQLQLLLGSEVWKDSKDVLVAHLMRTYGEGFTEGLQMAAQLIGEMIEVRTDLTKDEARLLSDLADVFLTTAANVPQVWNPPPPEVVDQDC
jgi:hypothetical protein